MITWWLARGTNRSEVSHVVSMDTSFRSFFQGSTSNSDWCAADNSTSASRLFQLLSLASRLLPCCTLSACRLAVRPSATCVDYEDDNSRGRSQRPDSRQRRDTANIPRRASMGEGCSFTAKTCTSNNSYLDSWSCTRGS